MSQKVRRRSSVYDTHTRYKDEDLLQRKIRLSGRQLAYGIILGVFLTIITIVLQCVAFFTPHWKEISPNTHSLYIDGVDALIRTEVLVYFNTIHRFHRHSYGLFQRCEYPINNSSKLNKKLGSIFDLISTKYQRTCTKNFLPSFEDNEFDECHSLPYYRFCSKANEKHFNINNDYLQATFDIVSSSHINTDSISSCDCHYPTYVKACHILGIFALIFLLLTVLFFGSFPFLKNRRQRLKIKCFAVLCSLLSTLFLLIHLLVILSHLEYELIEYLVAIERHYRSSQIYKLSQDTKQTIERFLSSIKIEIGYSTILAWIAFFLSIIDGILLMLTCKITQPADEIDGYFTARSRGSFQLNNTINSEESQAPSTPLTYVSNATLASFHPLPSQTPVMITISEGQSTSTSYTPPSCLKRNSSPRTHFEDAV